MDSLADQTCPAGHPLEGLGTFCWECGSYVADLDSAGRAELVATDDTRSEKEVEWAVIGRLKELGFKVWKLSQPRATMQTEGIADLFVTGRGLCAWVEVKRWDGEQSEAQMAFEAAVTANGGLYILARSEADVMVLAER